MSASTLSAAWRGEGARARRSLCSQEPSRMPDFPVPPSRQSCLQASQSERGLPPALTGCGVDVLCQPAQPRYPSLIGHALDGAMKYFERRLPFASVALSKAESSPSCGRASSKQQKAFKETLGSSEEGALP